MIRSIKRKLLLVSMSLLTLFYSCEHTDERDKEYLKTLIEKIKERDSLNMDLMFSSYQDDQCNLLLPFKIQEKCLVFKFSDQDCSTCIDTIVTLIKEQQWGNKIKVEIWNQIEGARGVYANKEWYNKIRQVEFREIGKEVDILNSNKYNKPFFFILNPEENKVSSIFFPDAQNTYTTTHYLKIIKRKYFEQIQDSLLDSRE